MLISDFARLGQVSVRMLRYYDGIGLLKPGQVDTSNGYRSYSPEQLSTLNRIVALKDLGLNLDQVRAILVDQLQIDELHGMLRLRRSELEGEVRAAGTRLAAVESRIRMIEKENIMSTDYAVKPIPGMRLAAVTDTIDPAQLGRRIGPMFEHVKAELTAENASQATAVGTYTEVEAGMAVVVGYAYDSTPPPSLESIELPAATAVCSVHLGPTDTVQESWQALHKFVAESEFEYDGPARELYVRAEDQDQNDWVTELQQPIRRP